MSEHKPNPWRSYLLLLGFIVWLIMNIRVKAGVGTTLERAVDGLVGGVVVLAAIFLAWTFFFRGD